MNAVNTTLAAQGALDAVMYGRVIAAFVFVVALIYLSAALVRRYGIDKRMAGGKSMRQTLSVTETLYLDPRRRVVVLKAGSKEHILLLTPTRDVVIATQDAEAASEKP